MEVHTDSVFRPRFGSVSSTADSLGLSETAETTEEHLLCSRSEACFIDGSTRCDSDGYSHMVPPPPPLTMLDGDGSVGTIALSKETSLGLTLPPPSPTASSVFTNLQLELSLSSAHPAHSQPFPILSDPRPPSSLSHHRHSGNLIPTRRTKTKLHLTRTTEKTKKKMKDHSLTRSDRSSASKLGSSAMLMSLPLSQSIPNPGQETTVMRTKPVSKSTAAVSEETYDDHRGVSAYSSRLHSSIHTRSRSASLSAADHHHRGFLPKQKSRVSRRGHDYSKSTKKKRLPSSGSWGSISDSRDQTSQCGSHGCEIPVRSSSSSSSSLSSSALRMSEMFLCRKGGTETKKVGRDKHTVYEFLVSYGTVQWSSIKRYREFVTFHASLLNFLKMDSPMIAAYICDHLSLPKKTGLFKRFDQEFIEQRHSLLCSYLNSLCDIGRITETDLFLSFVGALDNFQADSLRREYLARQLSVDHYCRSVCRTGDVLLFQTESRSGAGVRVLTRSKYDHCAVVFRFDGCSNGCSNTKTELSGVFNGRRKSMKKKSFGSSSMSVLLLEATAEGVKKYPLLTRLKQWSMCCSVISVRRLTGISRGFHFEKQARKFLDCVSGSDYSLAALFRYPTALSGSAVSSSTMMSASVSSTAAIAASVTTLGMTSITTVFRRREGMLQMSGDTIENDSLLLSKDDSMIIERKKRKFYCAQLVAEFLVEVGLLPSDKSVRLVPGDFADDGSVGRDLRFGTLMPECLLTFQVVALDKAQHRGSLFQIHRRIQREMTRSAKKTPIQKRLT